MVLRESLHAKETQKSKNITYATMAAHLALKVL
jgi:hypothetical protein